MHRLFVGLRPPAPVRATLLAIMGGIPRARWQEDDQLHLTLRFIGEVDRRQAEDIVDALGRIRAATPQASLDAVGTFDNVGRANAIWAGVTPRDALTLLHNKVDRALIAVGLETEHRTYVPHITLARLPRSAGVGPEIARFVADHAGFTSAPFVLSHLILFESHLGHERARYQTVERWPLD